MVGVERVFSSPFERRANLFGQGIDMDLDVFRQSLAETVAWCSRHASEADPAGSLRTPVLRPTNLNAMPNEWGNFDYAWGTREQNQSAFTALAQRRAERLWADGDYPEDVPSDWSEGRLLIAVPWESDWCCLSEPESRGFIDGLDVPAWDTWLGYVEEPNQPDPEAVQRTQKALRSFYGKRNEVWQPPPMVSHLLCWVPPAFLDLVEVGIAVNPTECFFWAADYRRRHHSTPLMRQLDAAGWLR